ncbi:sulfonate transport system ATP-binding protein [Planctomycetaceae bacterium]|nr:sulfonate transport system ATP-binding protein [Planctomycetaceae bacterium]
MSSVNPPIVEIRELRKSYLSGENRITPLDGINLDIAEGEFLAIMGPSGSGKTTLMNIIAGIDRPSSGVVRVAGVSLGQLSDAKLSRWRNRNVGYVFQQFNLMPVLNALENVELPLLLSPLKHKIRKRQAPIALTAVGLEDRMHHFPRQLSGGQQQRVAIARAIVTDPRILVCDEPTGNLDRESEEDVLDILTQLNARFGKTIILVTHDPHAAARARRHITLDKGVFSEAPSQPVKSTAEQAA